MQAQANEPLAAVWPPGPAHPRLAEDAVHVWHVDLRAAGQDVIALLCAAERERAERMVSGRAGKRWSIARGTLRALLGCYLGADPRTLRFANGAHGKPALIPDDLDSPPTAGPSPEGPTRVAFNMTHSGWLALYAFTRVGEVGVDVQVARQPTNAVAIAARAFGADEARRLAALDQAAGEQEFLRAWVRHEAKLKWLGIGICCPERRGGEPLVVQLAVGPSAEAAVAVEPATREIRCWRYRPSQAQALAREPSPSALS